MLKRVVTFASTPRAAFGVARADVPGVLSRARSMYAAMVAAVGLFPSPTVSMVAFLDLIEALELAQQQVSMRTRGFGTLRNTKRNAVWTAMESLRIYVQGLADNLDAMNAAALIEGAGLLVGGVAGHSKALLQAKLTTTPGVVHVIANASLLVGKGSKKKVTFNWQWSGDGGHTWNDAAATPYADTQIANLALMTEHWFRVSVTIGRVTGGWTDHVSLLVH